MSGIDLRVDVATAPGSEGFGARLKEAMHAAGVRNPAVAEATGVHVGTVSYWRSGKQRPDDDDTWTALATLLGVRKAWLRDGEEPMRPGVGREEGEPRLPRRFTASTGLPYEVRTWLQAELLDYMRARVPDEELDAAEQLYRSPEVFSFYAGGQPQARTEEDVLKTMRAIAIVVRTVFRRRGYDVEADTTH